MITDYIYIYMNTKKATKTGDKQHSDLMMTKFPCIPGLNELIEWY